MTGLRSFLLDHIGNRTPEDRVISNSDQRHEKGNPEGAYAVKKGSRAPVPGPARQLQADHEISMAQT
jgi:hypothetical protein